MQHNQSKQLKIAGWLCLWGAWTLLTNFSLLAVNTTTQSVVVTVDPNYQLSVSGDVTLKITGYDFPTNQIQAISTGTIPQLSFSVLSPPFYKSHIWVTSQSIPDLSTIGLDLMLDSNVSASNDIYPHFHDDPTTTPLVLSEDVYNLVTIAKFYGGTASAQYPLLYSLRTTPGSGGLFNSYLSNLPSTIVVKVTYYLTVGDSW